MLDARRIFTTTRISKVPIAKCFLLACVTVTYLQLKSFGM